MRIDKYIWCVRLYKTRTLASKEVSSDKVKLNDEFVKTSKEVKVDDEIALKRGPIWKSYKIKGIPKSRVGAKLVSELLEETTPWADLEYLERVDRENRENRIKGLTGRPTKKRRRSIEQFRKGFEEDSDN